MTRPQYGGITHGSIYVLGTALQGLGVLLVLPFLTRMLGPDEYGRVAVAIVIVVFASMVISAGMPPVILREYFAPGGRDRARSLAGALTLTAGALVTVGTIVTLVVVAVADQSGQADQADATSPTWTLAFVAAAGYAGVESNLALFRAGRRPVPYLASVLSATVGAQSVGLLVVLASPSAEAFMTGYAATIVLTGAVGATVARPLPPWTHADAVRSGLANSLPLIPQGIALLFLYAGDTWLVSRRLGFEQAGRYQIALTIGLLPVFLALALNNAWSPLILRAGPDERWAYLKKTGAPLLGLVSACAIAVAALAPLELAILSGPDFDRGDLVSVVATIAMTGPLMLLYYGASLVVIQLGRTVRLAAISLASAGVLLAVALLTLTPWGIQGAAFGKVLGYAALAALTALLAAALAGHGLWAMRTVLLSLALSACLVTATAVAPVSAGGTLVRAAALLVSVSWVALIALGARRRALYLTTASGPQA